MTTGVAIVSGGMDSVTMLHMLAAEGDNLVVVGFDYGQRHRKELRFAEQHAHALNGTFIKVPMAFMADLLHGSSLTSDNVDVPDGHYAAETMKATVVPNRNMIMLSVAAGIAVAEKAEYVATAVHAGDHFIYPDCRPEFIIMASETIAVATKGFSSWRSGPVVAPFVEKTKTDIVTIGHELGVDYSLTWTCYKGMALHCGSCGTCVERKEAFRNAEVHDPTEYYDASYLVQAYQ